MIHGRTMPARSLRNAAIAAAVSVAIAESAAAQAPQAAPDVIAEVTVTATRRSESIQDIPFNIAAVAGEQIAEQGLVGVVDLARWTPGLYVADSGRRSSNDIVIRGLSIGGVASPGFMDNDAGGTVASYIGEVPLYLDLRLQDIERVEVLLGPQGTLYGAGTLAGAVRYIPRRPDFAKTTLALRADAYGYSESDGIGADAGFTLNVPLAEHWALRASVDYLDDPGFIDYTWLVRDPGVSDPEPEPGNEAANLRTAKDADDEQTLSGRIALRWQPSEILDTTLTYFYQDQKVGANTANHSDAMGTGNHESASRYLTGGDRRNQLLSLEMVADLGFAELTSATGFSEYDGGATQDLTDTLITLEYSYEAFPSFSAYSPYIVEQERFNQELRLVSKTDGRLDWLVGAFYNQMDAESTWWEYTPHFDEFAVDFFGGTQLRPDGLELFNINRVDLAETAAFAELSWHFTDAWQITVGGRWYDYELDTSTAFDLPLYETVYNGRDPDSIVLDFTDGGQSDHGTLFKFNTSYDFSDDLMVYLTVSEGYRIGNSNGVRACPDPLPPGQGNCALPNEFQYFPDKTVNTEVGLRSSWLDRRLVFNTSIFQIDWEDPQLRGLTENGAIGITVNGKGARTRGFDFSLMAAVTERFSVRASYAYTKAELTELATDLLRTIPPDGGFGGITLDGEPGDRLPGSPQHQGSLYASYLQPLASGRELSFNYGITAIGNVLTTVGGRADGETLPGFAVSSASVKLAGSRWSLALYADNLFDKYAVTGVSQNPNYNQQVADINGDPVTVRWRSKSLIAPRQFGLRFTHDFNF